MRRWILPSLVCLGLAACDVYSSGPQPLPEPAAPQPPNEVWPEPPVTAHRDLKPLPSPPSGFQQMTDVQIRSAFANADIDNPNPGHDAPHLEHFAADGKYTMGGGRDGERRGRWWAQEGRLCHSTGSDVVCRRVLLAVGRTYFASVEVANLDRSIPLRATFFAPIATDPQTDDAGDRPARITNPQWLRKADGDDMDRYYPARARDQGIDGRATVECVVTSSGTLTSCSVVGESPAGAGFGAATIRAASKFKMRPKTADGRPVQGARVRVPMTWRLPREPHHYPASGPPRASWEPGWLAKPSAAQLERAYPPRALQNGVIGSTVLQCEVTSAGTLSACSVIAETPEGQGFGAAALRVSKYFRTVPRDRAGEPFQVIVPIQWRPS